ICHKTPGQISRQSSAIDFTSHGVGHVRSASRQRQSSHENVTQSPNPFQHYSPSSGNFTLLASASPPNPPQCFACLRACTALDMRLQHCPPISVFTTPYALTPLPLPFLCSRGALPTCSQQHLSLRLCNALPTCSQHHLSLRLLSALPTSSRHCLPSVRLQHALPTPLILTLAECPPKMLLTPLMLTLAECTPDILLTLLTIFRLAECTPDMLPTPLIFTLGVHSQHCLEYLRSRSALPTCSQHHLSLRLCSALPTQLAILTLAACPPGTAYSYARGVHSRHAPDTTYPYARGAPSRHPPDTAYYTYACGVHSRHAPDTTYPYACVVPSRHPPNTAYHPYAFSMPSRHAPDTTYPYACGVHSLHAPDTTYPYASVVPS
ncbi:hypothetical protein O181_117773, partial [Austropuccinia psidii MF-1]|nr:hypothetical protein [Austropuccinia psidii MF-1]